MKFKLFVIPSNPWISFLVLFYLNSVHTQTKTADFSKEIFRAMAFEAYWLDDNFIFLNDKLNLFNNSDVEIVISFEKIDSLLVNHIKSLKKIRNLSPYQARYYGVFNVLTDYLDNLKNLRAKYKQLDFYTEKKWTEQDKFDCSTEIRKEISEQLEILNYLHRKFIYKSVELGKAIKLIDSNLVMPGNTSSLISISPVNFDLNRDGHKINFILNEIVTNVNTLYLLNTNILEIFIPDLLGNGKKSANSKNELDVNLSLSFTYISNIRILSKRQPVLFEGINKELDRYLETLNAIEENGKNLIYYQEKNSGVEKYEDLDEKLNSQIKSLLISQDKIAQEILSFYKEYGFYYKEMIDSNGNIKYPIALPKNFKDIESSCIQDELLAIRDVKTYDAFEIMVFGYMSFQHESLFGYFYENYLWDFYKIDLVHMGCVYRESCYQDKMYKLIYKKYGKDIFKRARKEAKKAFIKMGKDTVNIPLVNNKGLRALKKEKREQLRKKRLSFNDE